MEISYILILAVLLCLGIISYRIYNVVVLYRKGHENIFNTLNKVKTLALEFFKEALDAKIAEDRGFDGIKEFILNKIMAVIENDGISEFEAKYLTRQNIDFFITPILKELLKHQISTDKYFSEKTLYFIKEKLKDEE